ncbi:MAG TPA: OmpA family protein, partial [Saprospiraceae bacterium]|nr:OmpA family protein [Saprospiraceae bacterium]
ALILLLVLLLPLAQAQDFILERLPEPFNSEYDEINPLPSRDGNTLFFTRVGYPNFCKTLIVDSVDQSLSRSPEDYQRLLVEVYSAMNGRPVINPERSPFNQDIWIAAGDSAQFRSLVHPGWPLNNAYPNSMATITPDPNAFYVINQFSPSGEVNRGFSVIRRTADSLGWSQPQPVNIRDYYTITSDVNLTMSFDGQVLILAAAREDSKDMDLYACFREGEHQWSAPKHLGPIINSERRELTPFLSEDNTTLFFASNRSSALGGNDLYVSRRLDDTWANWSPPERMVVPINSTADESQPYFNMSSGYLYFSSKREGNSDIFRIQIAEPQPTEITIVGRVLNWKTKQLVSNATVYYTAPNVQENSVEAADGTFRLKVPKGVEFQIWAEKPTYSSTKQEVYFRRDYYYFPEYYVDVYVEPLEVNAKIELRPVFFQQSKAVILEESYAELRRLATVMLENPSLHIRVEGHTDNVGRAEDLMQLSEDRAIAVKVFLLRQGVAADRIESVGFGPKFPLNDNSNDDLRSINRRVEVVITKR